MAGRLLLPAALVAAAVVATAGESAPAAGCAPPRAGAAYERAVTAALRARRDVWGEALLRAPGGPTYEGASRHLAPLLLARAPGKRPLTASGFHYVALSHPEGVRGAGSVALHVADGSEIVAERVGGPSLTVRVGGERFGACRARLALPRLADGWLPILRTRYGAYEQESFARRVAGRGLVSYVRVSGPGAIALAPSGGRALRARGTVYATWAGYTAPRRVTRIDASAYEEARRAVAGYWERRLAEGTRITVPEPVVQDALRNLLVQNLGLTWRYSIGNPYEQFSFPESVDVAQVMAGYGFHGVSRSILRTSLTRKATPYPNWKRGQRLVGSAVHYRLFRDRAYVRQVTPVLRGYVAALGRQIDADPRGLLARERYSSDIAASVYGLHAQAVAWQGLRAMGDVWRETGQRALADRCARLAARLEAGLRRAVAASQRRLPDGSLFLPARLLDGERPYGSLTEARLGSYWNLVVPYALASGLFPPGGPQAEGAWRYMERHGSRLLGLVRAGAYALYRDPVHPVSGTDQVYGINVARFLADNDRADHLVLSLYGHLAAGMAPGTFVSGEAAGVAPLGGLRDRAMYLPPNGASNAAFLENLRVMLVHEPRDRRGRPTGIRLAHATPRGWLRPGPGVSVRDAPTSFGRVSFAIVPREDGARVTVDAPAAPSLKLRLRLPGGKRIARVALDGADHPRFAGDTVDLSGRSGALELEVEYR